MEFFAISLTPGKQRKLAQVNASNASKIDWASNDKNFLEIKIWHVNKQFSDQNCSYNLNIDLFHLLEPFASQLALSFTQLALVSRLLAFVFIQLALRLTLLALSSIKPNASNLELNASWLNPNTSSQKPNASWCKPNPSSLESNASW